MDSYRIEGTVVAHFYSWYEKEEEEEVLKSMHGDEGGSATRNIETKQLGLSS